VIDVDLSNAGHSEDWEPHKLQEHCLPKADWQTKSFPNCNSIHEISLPSSIRKDRDDRRREEDALSNLGEGWFRTTWQLDRALPSSKPGSSGEESMVLKTLRIAREYVPEYYELHRRDAVAMERLTASPFVVDVFGYCGQSALNELANFPFPGVQSLESFDKRMRGRDSAKANLIKLRMAASIALGVADIHAAGAADDDNDVYMAHYDLNPRNIALFAGGKPKINDFNIAEFLKYDPSTNRTCGFPSRLHEPWWRAPEEMNVTHTVLVDEKVDVYALGNILFHALTTHSPRGKLKKERMDIVRPDVARGVRPPIPPVYANDSNPAVVAMIKAIDLCWVKDPAKRGTAEEVAAILYNALLNTTDAPQMEEKLQDEIPQQLQEDDDETEDGVEDKDAMGH
jgi:serine/threonine protein kinase